MSSVWYNRTTVLVWLCSFSPKYTLQSLKEMKWYFKGGLPHHMLQLGSLYILMKKSGDSQLTQLVGAFQYLGLRADYTAIAIFNVRFIWSGVLVFELGGFILAPFFRCVSLLDDPWQCVTHVTWLAVLDNEEFFYTICTDVYKWSTFTVQSILLALKMAVDWSWQYGCRDQRFSGPRGEAFRTVLLHRDFSYSSKAAGRQVMYVVSQHTVLN